MRVNTHRGEAEESLQYRKSMSLIYFTAFDIQSVCFGLHLYSTSLKLEQEQPEL